MITALFLASFILVQDPAGPESQKSDAPARPVSEKDARDALMRLQPRKNERPSLAQRVQQVEALATMQHKLLVKPLADLVRNDKALTVRKAAARGLAKQLPGDAHPTLVALLKEDPIKDAPEVAAVVVEGLAGPAYTGADWEAIEPMFERDFTPVRIPLQQAILKIAKEHKEKLALKLLLKHLDPPIPEDVDTGSNPPADYWEKRWKAWKVWKGDVSDAVFAITSQRFATSKEAKAWLKVNGKRLGLTSG